MAEARRRRREDDVTRILVTMMSLLCLTGCPTNDTSTGPVDTCEKAGQQCRLGGGQLGVCSMQTDGELVCTSQH